ncbi:hypothetical protein G7046_g7893 [Stylonectria norvegica]|nr:hypothetical protein G7046_g7893 [Stylonectria norvegica]
MPPTSKAPTWDEYIRENGFADVWNPPNITETDKYTFPEIPVSHLSLAEIREAAARHKRVEIYDLSMFDIGLYTKMTLDGPSNSLAKQVTVARTLDGSRYYLGHSGGDYIFQAPLLRPKADRLEFCGLTPRPDTLHTRRLDALIPDVVKMLVSIIGYIKMHLQQSSSYPNELNDYLARGKMTFRNRQAVLNMELLRECWETEIGQQVRLPTWTKIMIRSSPIVREYAYLVENQLKLNTLPETEARDWNPNMVLTESRKLTWIRDVVHPLSLVITEAAKLDLQNLAKLYYEENLTPLAWKELRRGDEAEHVLVFQSVFVGKGLRYPSIHDFYAEPHYENDPFHPAKFSQQRRPVPPPPPREPSISFKDWNPLSHNQDLEPSQQDVELSRCAATFACLREQDRKIKKAKVLTGARTASKPAEKNDTENIFPPLDISDSEDEAKTTAFDRPRKLPAPPKTGQHGLTPIDPRPLRQARPLNRLNRTHHNDRPPLHHHSGLLSAPSAQAGGSSQNHQQGSGPPEQARAQVGELPARADPQTEYVLAGAAAAAHGPAALFRRKQHDAIDQERHRMHSGMYNACEELRKTVGPGSRGEGYLYRVAMEKKGVWGTEGVPIEYARFQTDFPGKEAWNHAWKR